MNVELWPIERITPYQRNPRDARAAVAPVADSIREFGFRVPIVVDRDGVIISGHTRFEAAKRLGLTHVPVHVASDLTADQVKALRIADNKLHELSTWNAELLASELADLKSVDFDLSLLGFSGEDLAAILGPGGTEEGLTDPDETPAPPGAATTVRGDLWVLGDHRLMCGDSGKPEDVDRLLDGQTIHLVNTDPPYNTKVAPRSNDAIVVGLNPRPFRPMRKTHGRGLRRANTSRIRATHATLRAKDRPIAGDFVSDDEYDRMLAAWFSNIARVLMPGGTYYIWGGYATCDRYLPALMRCGLYFSQVIIWIKEHPVLVRKDFMNNHECCFYGWKEGAAHRFFGPHDVPDTWTVKRASPQRMIHIMEKPVELARRAIEYSSRPGENVLDLFGGSGSTLIGAEMTGRRAYLMEIDPLYCDVIVQRWEQFTGRKAERIPCPDRTQTQTMSA